MICDFYPIVKKIDFHSKMSSDAMQEAKLAVDEGQLDRAFELYNQACNMLLQATGAMTEDVAACITKMANIQYRFRDSLQAIELQTKALIIQEKLLGHDDPTVAYSYSNLGLYYHSCQYFSKGFGAMRRAVQIL